MKKDKNRCPVNDAKNGELMGYMTVWCLQICSISLLSWGGENEDGRTI